MDENTMGITVEEYLNRAQVLISSAKFEEAIVCCDKALAINVRAKEGYILKGVALAYLEKLDEAEKCFDRALRLDKNDPDAYFHLGNIAFLRDDFKQGVKYYNLAIANGYESPDIYYQLGLLYEQHNDTAEALRQYSHAIRMDEVNAIYRIKKAVLQLQTGDYTGTLETTEGLRKFCPDSFDGYHLCAAAHTMLKQFEEAKAVLMEARKMFPDDREILMDYIRVLVNAGELYDAMAVLEVEKDRAESDAERQEIYLNLGKIYLQNGQDEKAEEALERSVEYGGKDSVDFEALFLLVNMYHYSKKYSRMLEAANKLSALKSLDPYGLCGMYFAALAQKNISGADYKKAYTEAARYYRQVSLQNPARVDVSIYRAMCHKDLGEYEQALECVDYVLLLAPENGNLHSIRGSILKDMKRDAEAQEAFRQAKRLGATEFPGIEVE